MNPSTNHHRRLFYRQAVFFACLAPFVWAFLGNAAEISPAPTVPPAVQRYKLRVNDRALDSRIIASGGRLMADYGSFQIFVTDEAGVQEFGAIPGIEDATEQNLIALNTGSLDTTSPDLRSLQTSLALHPGKRLYLVQFVGPIKPEWRADLEATGVEVITYIPHNAYLVYGDSAALSAMQAWSAGSAHVQWHGSWLDSYKIHPGAQAVDSKGQRLKPMTDVVTIQLVADPEANAGTLQLIDELKLEAIKDQSVALGYLNVTVRLPADRLVEVAARPEVVSIQPNPEPKKRDERQDQIMAGALTGNNPTGPGYLAWLASKGFTQAQFTSSAFTVDITDSGIDNGTTSPGHFGLYVSGDSSLSSRVIYNRLVGTPHSGSTIQACDGHGNLNAHIVAGFNDQPLGFPHTDVSGFHFGLGVCPFVTVGSSVIFDPNTYTTPNLETLQSQAYNDGARISGNSWGANTAGGYNSNAQRYDALVRDAQPAASPFPAAGNQEMVIVFAAGNAGPGAGSVGAPGTAKNVFSIGAAENAHSHSTANGGNNAAGDDGCDVDDTGANSANDIIDFSSRGPCADGRKKPDIMAPGTHVTGGVGQQSPPPSPAGTGTALACFEGTGVCALSGSSGIGNPNNFFPLGQQFYSTSSGTSHSTPGMSGACALLRQYFINNSLTPPSPAMTKAYLMNSARYMNGVGANDTLPSNNQGMGEVNLSTAFDGANRVLFDQTPVDKFTASGQFRTYVGTIPDSTKPFRVTLAWTDAPGNTSGNSYNNDLDLTVTAGGNTYKGNVFTGANSAPGGSADFRDNVESVFIPAGVSGNYVVTVTAVNINSDGVPNEAPSLDQDFALVIYNADLTPVPVISPDSVAITAESCAPTNNAADPGETITVLLALKNVGSSNTVNVTATLLPTNGVMTPSAPQAYGPLLVGGSAATMPFTFAVSAACGGVVSPTLHLQDGSLDLGTVTFFLQVGQLATTFSQNFDGVSVPALPVDWTTSASSGQSIWVTVATQSDTAPNSAFSPDPATTGVNELISASINVPSTPSQVSFRHTFSFENGYDGGVLEISLNGESFLDILTVGGSFVSGAYSRALNSSVNPLSTRQAWTGSSGGFLTTLINLPPGALGQPVRFRWRAGSDSSIGGTGWFVDSLTLISRACCGVLAPPISAFSGAPTSGTPPLVVTFTDTSTGTITNRFWSFGNGNTTNTAQTTFTFTYLAPGTNTVALTTTGPLGNDTQTRTAYIIVTNPSATLMSNEFGLLVEGCPNGLVDADETVTVNFGLKNIGSAPTVNLVATLLATGGINSPSAPQTYGVISGGGTASMPFTFTANGLCGDMKIATLQLQDGAANLGTVTFSFGLSTITPLIQNFDGVTPPVLPIGWTTATSGAQSLWVTSIAQRDTLPNAAFSTDVGSIGVNQLISPLINLPVGASQLKFRHSYNLEAGTAPGAFDGGVLEIAIAGGGFTDILAAGGSFANNGYNRTIGTTYSNPLGGRQAWSANSGGFVTTIVDLPAVASGESIQLRWRCGTDSSISAPGWYVDTLSVSAVDCCAAPPTLLNPHLAPDGRLVFTLSGQAGYNYEIQTSTDLINWNLSDTIFNPSGQVIYTVNEPPGEQFRVYRAKRQ